MLILGVFHCTLLLKKMLTCSLKQSGSGEGPRGCRVIVLRLKLSFRFSKVFHGIFRSECSNQSLLLLNPWSSLTVIQCSSSLLFIVYLRSLVMVPAMKCSIQCHKLEFLNKGPRSFVSMSIQFWMVKSMTKCMSSLL